MTYHTYYVADGYLISLQRTHGLKYPFMVKRLACMVISGVARSDSVDILQPANLTPQMISRMEEEFGLLWNAFRKTLISDEDIS
ncbi:hypothetical protein Ahy_A02g004990 isoform C [Arachis hypogaea]|uniref:Uncharacterized protein n=1 Tax=Arachis hypogaea TaxID=3818 RepID=A0A445E5S8_ARAHY|nr:hypothetical protein Ahy_A02g004990 isoform C [Arachis hypogaea]